MKSLEDRVAAGAEWLDRKDPGWAEKMVLSRLDMSRGSLDPSLPSSDPDGCGCVGAQLAAYVDGEPRGEYWDALARRGARAISTLARYGFLMRRGPMREWDGLWADQIRARRKASP